MGSHIGEVRGKVEDFTKLTPFNEHVEVKATEYGALHVEQFVGRLLETLTPPSEPNAPANKRIWTVPESHDPRMIYCDVMPSGRTKIGDTWARVRLVYNVSGEDDGDTPTEIAIPSGDPRPCPGVKSIEVLSGRVSVYGNYTKVSATDE